MRPHVSLVVHASPLCALLLTWSLSVVAGAESDRPLTQLTAATGPDAPPQSLGTSEDGAGDLIVRFGASANALPIEAIRSAIAAELSQAVRSDGSAEQPSLHVSVLKSDELELIYEPERARIVRRIPLPASAAIPEQVAHLAGNMVRDQASGMLETLCAKAQPPPAQPAARESRAPATPSSSTMEPRTLPRSFEADTWLTSVLASGSFGPDEGAHLSVGEARRLGRRVELGLALELGAARADAEAYNADGTYFALRVTQAQLTVPVTFDVRVLGGHDALLLLGATAGLRIAGVLSNAKLSGSDPMFAAALRATAVFTLSGPHRLMFRGSWAPLPQSHRISILGGSFAGWPEVNGLLQVVPSRFGFEIGYQYGRR